MNSFSWGLGFEQNPASVPGEALICRRAVSAVRFDIGQYTWSFQVASRRDGILHLDLKRTGSGRGGQQS